MRTECRAIRPFAFLVSIFATCAFASRPVADHAYAVEPYSAEIRELQSDLRSSSLRDQALRQGILLVSGDRELTRESIDFFGDLSAKPILLRAMSDWRQGLDVRSYAAQVLASKIPPGDVSLVRSAFMEFQASATPTSGGSEVRLAWVEYRWSLAKLLARQTGMTIDAPDVPGFAWSTTTPSETLAASHNFPDTTAAMLSDSVGRWLKKQEGDRK